VQGDRGGGGYFSFLMKLEAWGRLLGSARGEAGSCSGCGGGRGPGPDEFIWHWVGVGGRVARRWSTKRVRGSAQRGQHRMSLGRKVDASLKGIRGVEEAFPDLLGVRGRIAAYGVAWAGTGGRNPIDPRLGFRCGVIAHGNGRRYLAATQKGDVREKVGGGVLDPQLRADLLSIEVRGRGSIKNICEGMDELASRVFINSRGWGRILIVVRWGGNSTGGGGGVL